MKKRVVSCIIIGVIFCMRLFFSMEKSYALTDADTSEGIEAYETLIEKMIDFQNEHSWKEYSELYCDSMYDMYDYFFSDSQNILEKAGIMGINTAELEFAEEVEPELLQGNLNLDSYSDIKAFLSESDIRWMRLERAFIMA